MGTGSRKKKRKYVSLYSIVNLWWKTAHTGQKELLAKVLWDVGRRKGKREHQTCKKIWTKSSGIYLAK